MNGTVSVRSGGIPAWAWALGALVLLMLGANGAMVWLSSRGHRDLVRSDYYDAGLDQDGTMARAEMARRPGMGIGFRRDGNAWTVESGSQALTGAGCEIHLYRPDNGAEDRILKLGAARSISGNSGALAWSCPRPVLRRGFWVARLVWVKEGKAVMEESFRIYVDG